jgi:hypothetical protein
MLNNQVELLAPAGKWDVLQSVAQAGADAVYAGGKRFNMRMLRPDFNFSDRELKQAADYLHDLGKRLVSVSIIDRKRRQVSLFSMAPSKRVSTNPLIDVKGVLSSWDTLATNPERI